MMTNTFTKSLVLMAMFGANAFAQDHFREPEGPVAESEVSPVEPLGRIGTHTDSEFDPATGMRFKRITTTEWKRVFDAFANQYRFVQVAVEKWVPVEENRGPQFPTFFLNELGATVKQFSDHGFEVVHVEMGSLAQRLNMTEGDRLSKINHERVLSIGQLESALRSSFELEFYRPSENMHLWAKHQKFGSRFFQD